MPCRIYERFTLSRYFSSMIAGLSRQDSAIQLPHSLKHSEYTGTTAGFTHTCSHKDVLCYSANMRVLGTFGIIYTCEMDYRSHLSTLQLTRSSSFWIICLRSPRASPCSFFTQNTWASSSWQAHERLPTPPLTRLCCFMWKTARSAS